MNDSNGSRRAFLRTLGAAGGALALGPSRWALAAPTKPARSVVVLWLWGGPSQIETFDPKPNAPVEYRGPFEPIATKVPGTFIGELLPKLAQRADKYAIIRSLNHESNDHGVAGTIALTGSKDGALALDGKAQANAVRPSVGSIVARVAKERGGLVLPEGLPPYVILGNELRQGHKRVLGEGGGVLGAAHDPLRLDYVPGKGLAVPNVEPPQGVGPDRQEGRFALRSALRSPDVLPAGRDWDRQHQLAQALMAAKSSLKVLDVESEPANLRATYGPTRFGQCCLAARRLVEAGLPFVQVNWSTDVEGPEDTGDGGWDMHDRYFEIMRDRHGWTFDRALSALLDDLQSRGLLESTMVVAIGEFGRTPKVNDKAGRDHWNPCYSALVAGGGTSGGAIVGASDRHAERPIERPVAPADLWATLLGRLGIGAAELTDLGLVPQGEPIHELFL